MSTIELVKAVLEQFPRIRDWYVTEHGLVVDQLTHESVRTYGTGGHGDIADRIMAEPEARFAAVIEALCQQQRAEQRRGGAL